MSAPYFVTPADAPQVEQVANVYRRTMATSERVMLCEFFLEREAVVQPHQHPADQVGYVVYGKLELTAAGETRVCMPGDTYQIPGGIEHSAKALVDTLLVEVFAPPREELRYQTK
jgi:quercetin dioxygenase-like cupin family protein